MRISVLIPTRERADYLGASIASVLISNDKEIELIVCDNASSDRTKEIVANFSDKRLKYINTGARISMRENFETALNSATGDYVIFIGDDDGLLAGQLPALRFILETEKPDVVVWPFLTYGWPVPGYKGKLGGIRFVRNRLFRWGFKIDSQACMHDLLHCHLTKLDHIPHIYHGCVSKAYLDRARTEDGSYFNSSIPDVYFSYRSIFEGGCFLHVNHPFTINGHSPASTGGGHHSYSSNDPRSKPGHMFASEVHADPKQDVMGHALSVALVFFSTLETLRNIIPGRVPQPDYVAWYKYVLSNVKSGDKPLLERVNAVLDDYAAKTGTQDALTSGRAKSSTLGRKITKLRVKFRQLGEKLQSFRITADIDGKNTVLTAARMFDDVAGNGFIDVLEGRTTSNEAWAMSKKRSRRYLRQV